MQSKMFGIAAFAAMAAIDGSANASTFDCNFPALERVIIATGKPKSITVYGEKKPAWSYDEIDLPRVISSRLD
ncbi:hypothetical protein [Ensifer sp. MJa1]|uniref:hypothetical protein n=1 Tax=Ensifer sp. MJa1 TaxID=2919888 RepID=UPI00300A113C